MQDGSNRRMVWRGDTGGRRVKGHWEARRRMPSGVVWGRFHSPQTEASSIGWPHFPEVWARKYGDFKSQAWDLLAFPSANSVGTHAPTSPDCSTSQSLYTRQPVMPHLYNFLINVWHLPPKTRTPREGALGVHHRFISAEHVLAHC